MGRTGVYTGHSPRRLVTVGCERTQGVGLGQEPQGLRIQAGASRQVFNAFKRGLVSGLHQALRCRL